LGDSPIQLEKAYLERNNSSHIINLKREEKGRGRGEACVGDFKGGGCNKEEHRLKSMRKCMGLKSYLTSEVETQKQSPGHSRARIRGKFEKKKKKGFGVESVEKGNSLSAYFKGGKTGDRNIFGTGLNNLFVRIGQRLDEDSTGGEKP